MGKIMTTEQNQNTPIIAYKGFDENWQCRGFQYKVGKTYEHKGEVKVCESGFHACEYPLNVFDYYEPAKSKFALVEMSGEIAKEENSDTKIAAAKIHIKAELKIPDLVNSAVEWINSKIDWDNKTETSTGDRSAATNTGDRSAAANTGDWSAATNTGYQSTASVEGSHSVAIAIGIKSKAKAPASGAIVCVYRNDDGELIHIKAAKVGENGIKADTFYTLNKNGEFVEVVD